MPVKFNSLLYAFDVQLTKMALHYCQFTYNRQITLTGFPSPVNSINCRLKNEENGW